MCMCTRVFVCVHLSHIPCAMMLALPPFFPLSLYYYYYYYYHYCYYYYRYYHYYYYHYYHYYYHYYYYYYYHHHYYYYYYSASIRSVSYSGACSAIHGGHSF